MNCMRFIVGAFGRENAPACGMSSVGDVADAIALEAAATIIMTIRSCLSE